MLSLLLLVRASRGDDDAALYVQADMSACGGAVADESDERCDALVCGLSCACGLDEPGDEDDEDDEDDESCGA